MIKGAPQRNKHYVVFCNGTRFWFLPWLKNGFTHCYIVKDCGSSWAKIQPYRGFSDVTVWSKDIFPKVTDVTYDDEKVLPIHTNAQHDRIRGHICWFNCVEVVKSFLGLKKPFIFTPYQLYRYIK